MKTYRGDDNMSKGLREDASRALAECGVAGDDIKRIKMRLGQAINGISWMAWTIRVRLPDSREDV